MDCDGAMAQGTLTPLSPREPSRLDKTSSRRTPRYTKAWGGKGKGDDDLLSD